MIIAFNAIQTLLLRDKLSGMGIEPHTWITDYLPARPQYVRLGVLWGTVGYCGVLGGWVGGGVLGGLGPEKIPKIQHKNEFTFSIIEKP